MAEIKERLSLADGFSAVFKQFNNAATSATQKAYSFGAALDDFREGFWDGFNQGLNETNVYLDEAANGSRRAAQGANDAANAQSRVTSETKATADAAAGWVNKIKSAIVAIGAVKLAKDFVESADSMMMLNQRLTAVGVSQEEAFRVAQRSRAEYSTIANLVAGIGRNASKTFNSKESLQFAENMSKMFKIAGTDQAGIASATLQLNQALASGVLRGEEFNAINENAHDVITLIAEEMGKQPEEMKELASQGKITADIIKNAVLGATSDIDKEFRRLPMTFKDVTTLFGNYLNNALSDKYLEWSEFLNSDEGMELITDIANALVVLAEIGTSVFMAIARAVSFVHDHIEDFMPLFDFLIAAAITYGVVQVAAGLKAAAAFAIANSEIIMALGLIALGIGVLQHFGVTFGDVGNFIGRLVGTIYAVIYNVIMWVWNLIDWVCNNFQAVMHNTAVDVIGIINNIGQTALDMVYTVAGAIDSVFGSNLAGSVDSLKGKLQGWADSFGEYTALADFNQHEYIDVNAKADEWGSVGEKLGAKLDGIGDTVGGIFEGVNDIGDLTGWTANSVGGTGEVGQVGKVGKIDGDVKLSDEDLKVYRDLAEQRYMNRIELQTLAPNINVSMPEGSNLDATDVANAIKAVLVEQMSANTAIAH